MITQRTLRRAKSTGELEQVRQYAEQPFCQVPWKSASVPKSPAAVLNAKLGHTIRFLLTVLCMKSVDKLKYPCHNFACSHLCLCLPNKRSIYLPHGIFSQCILKLSKSYTYLLDCITALQSQFTAALIAMSGSTIDQKTKCNVKWLVSSGDPKEIDRLFSNCVVYRL